MAQERGMDTECKAVTAEEVTLSLCTLQGWWLQILGAEGPFVVGVPWRHPPSKPSAFDLSEMNLINVLQDHTVGWNKA